MEAMSAVVVIHGHVFNDCVEHDGAVRVTGQIEGWESPEYELPTSRSGNRDGDVPGRALQRGRVLTVPGQIYTRDVADHWAASNWINALTNNTRDRRDLAVYEEDGIPKVVRYVRHSEPKIAKKHNRLIEFELGLLAPDPRKYAMVGKSVAIPAGGSAVLTNAGNYPGGSLTVVTAATSGTVDLRNEVTKQRLRTKESVPAGSVFDGYECEAMSGNLNLFPVMVPGFTWVEIVEGDQTLTNNGTAALTVDYFDAWL